MRSAGRNDPCPCGSGRRYKDCCSTGDPGRQPARIANNTRESSLTKLVTFAFQPVFDADHSLAEVVFWGDLLRRTTPADVQRLLDSDDASVKYTSWFLFDWEVDDSGTVADLFLDEQAARLSDTERQCLDRLSRAHLRLYEVEAVDRRAGVRLVDLWTGDRLCVTERPAAPQLATWDLLGARVAPDGVGGQLFEGGLYVYPASAKEQLLAQFGKAHRRFRRTSAGDDLATFFRKHGALFHHLWLELVAFPEPPQVMTADGDPLMFCRAVFETEHLDEVRTAIGGHPDTRPAADGCFTWHQPGIAGREVGRWAFESGRVVFETSSQARAARGRKWLEALAGDTVRYRATALETLGQAMSALRRPVTARGTPSAAGGDALAVKELFDRHYQSWLDRPDAAFGNHTPRAAARTRTWRPRLLEVLKQMENTAERAALAGRPSYDFHWIWRELGLDRPDSRE